MVVEVEVNIDKKSLSILIDLGSNHSYVTPKLGKSCSFGKMMHNKSWIVKLSTGTKMKVSEVVEKCPLMLNGLPIKADLNVLPLGSYDILIGMGWLEVHRAKLDCYNKILECIDDEGRPQLVKVMLKKVSLRKIAALQLRRYLKKNCQIYAIRV